MKVSVRLSSDFMSHCARSLIGALASSSNSDWEKRSGTPLSELAVAGKGVEVVVRMRAAAARARSLDGEGSDEGILQEIGWRNFMWGGE